MSVKPNTGSSSADVADHQHHDGPAPRTSPPPRDRQDQHQQHAGQIRPEVSLTDGPSRVDEDQIGWPNHFPEVEADGAARHSGAAEKPSDRTMLSPMPACCLLTSIQTISTAMSRKGRTRNKSRRSMRPCCHQTQASKTTGSVNAMPLANAERRKKPTDAASCHQRPSRSWRQVKEYRQQRQRQREHVFQLGNPRHALDVDRMQREDRRGEHGPGYSQVFQDSPHKNRRNDVQRDVDQMVSERMQAPHIIFKPIDRKRQRPIVDVIAGRPRLCQTVSLKHRVIQQVEIVIPNESALPGRLIRQEYCDNEGGGREPDSEMLGLQRGGQSRTPVGSLRRSDVSLAAEASLSPSCRLRQLRSSGGNPFFRLRLMGRHLDKTGAYYPNLITNRLARQSTAARRRDQEDCKVAITDNTVGTVILSAAKNLVGAHRLATRP